MYKAKIESFAYKIPAFICQSAIKIYLAAARTVFKISGGKFPKSMFCLRAGVKKTGTSVKIISQTDHSADIAKFDAEGNISGEDFIILSSTDFHFEGDREADLKTMKLFARRIEEIKPDLVVLTGDIILTNFQWIDAVRFARAMEKIGVYWAAVFGNHEAEEPRGFHKYFLLKSFSDYERCLCKFGPDELYGYGNYIVNVFGKGGKLLKSLFFFDSGRDITDETRLKYGISGDVAGYDFLKKEQTEFYKKEIDALTERYGDVESFVYLHIPLCEYALAFKPNENGEFVPSGECEIICGAQLENVCCSPYNSGFFDALLEKGGAKAVFCGHDHLNDWIALYKSVLLVYNLPGGYGGYGLDDGPEDERLQGATVTTVRSDGSFDIKQAFNRDIMKETRE